ncbi:transcription factor MYB98-like [Cicer arietinum]|uniref:Transcription factor MYB98-like n=1 Tax=Cicer arietinum TaxID=3827 RepID=A0A1S2Y6Z7_CICAR|nr:transcription factor MYB98-like [Cicer arietinum]
MNLETKLTLIYASKPQYSLENYYMKNHENPIGGFPNSSQGFMQDFNHINKFNVNGSFFNPVSGVQTTNFDPCDNFTYDFKPNLMENNGNGNAYVMDNFLYGGYGLNISQRNNNKVEMMVTNQQNYFPFNINSQGTKPLNFVVPDQISCISPMNYYKRIGMNRNNARKTEKVQKSNIVKGQWTVQEDRLLIQLVEKYGLRKWSHIAQLFPGRIGKQCRERWHNHLRPDIKKDIWSEEEDKILIKAHSEIGNKWAEIAKILAGRTENSIKNHWNATKRRQYSKRKCRSKYPRGTLLQEYIKSLNLDKNPPKDYRRKPTNNATLFKNKTSQITLSQTPYQQFCPNQCLVPSSDFDDVQDFESLFQDGCSIDSLLEDMKCGSSVNLVDETDIMGSVMVGVEVKKEMVSLLN